MKHIFLNLRTTSVTPSIIRNKKRTFKNLRTKNELYKNFRDENNILT